MFQKYKLLLKKHDLLLVLLIFAGILYLGCSGDTEIKCETGDVCEVSSSSENQGGLGEYSSSIISGTSSSSEILVGSSSSGSDDPSSSSISSSSSEYHPPTPPVPGENCAYKSNLCGGIAFEDVIISTDFNFENDETLGDGSAPTCFFATTITKLGNENGQGGGLRVNGIELKGNFNSGVNGRCGNTDWGQLPCPEAIANANVQKIDGGYYVYAPSWIGMVTTKGGEPVCISGSLSSSSRASSSSVAGTSSSSRASSSSVAGTSSSSRSSSSVASSSSRASSSSAAGTLTCGNVPSTGTANQSITAPVVQCNGSTVTSTNISGWTNAPNWNNPTAGTYRDIKVTVAPQATGSAQACRNMQASCSGTLTVNQPQAPSSSSRASSSSQGSGGSCQTCVPSSQLNGNAPTTRYWDSCKPSCSWPGKQTNGQGTARACNISGGILSDANAINACQNGPSFACMNQAPWSISDDISYGFAAAHTDADCGKCFQLEFTDNGEGGNSGSIIGKTFVVMINNIGDIRAGAAFDLMIPGGGVGDFDGLSRQLSSNGGSSSNLGERYGGFRGVCGNNVTCVQNMCNSTFTGNALSDLKKGCDWYVTWMKISNNPKVKYKEITCPDALKAKW